MRIDELIKDAYRCYLAGKGLRQGRCPDEEKIASFLDGKLGSLHSRRMEAHLVLCAHCAEIARLYCKISSNLAVSVPEQAVKKACSLVENKNIFDAVVRLRDKLMELLSTTGDIVHGYDTALLPVLRAAGISKFKEEIILFKEFEGIKIALIIDKKEGPKARARLSLSDRKSQPITDLRVTLFKDGEELESYSARRGQVVFEDLLYGSYCLELSRHFKKIGVIKMEIR